MAAPKNIPSRWGITFSKSERFSLNDESSKDKEMYSLSFFRGHNELMKLPVRKKSWLKWRQQLVTISQLSLAGGSCASPLAFSIEKPSQPLTKKEVCLSDKSTEIKDVRKLTADFNEYLYGK